MKPTRENYSYARRIATGMKMREHTVIRRFTLAIITLALLNTGSAFAAVPSLLNYQGVLRDAAGDIVPDGNFSVTFRIWDGETGGTALWQEARLLTLQDGLFTVLLGSIVPIPDTLFKSSDRWIGLQVGLDTEMTPRQRLVTVPFAWQALNANTADTASAAKTVDTSGYSAYADLLSEGKIGNQAGQVAAGGHVHSLDSATLAGLRAFFPISALDVTDNTSVSTTSQTYVTVRSLIVPADSVSELIVRFNLRPISSTGGGGQVGRCRARVLFGPVSCGEVLSPITNPDFGGYTGVFALRIPPPTIRTGGTLELQLRVEPNAQDANNDYWEVWGR